MLCQLSEGSVTIYSRIAGNAPETTDAVYSILKNMLHLQYLFVIKLKNV